MNPQFGAAVLLTGQIPIPQSSRFHVIPTTFASGDIATVVEKFPVGPCLLAELGEQLQQGDVDLDRVTVILRRDPALMRGIIAAANSEVYLRDEPTDSIEDAVARLGQRDTFRVAALIAFDQVNHEPLPLYGLTPEQLRTNALFTALVMEELAGAVEIESYLAFVTGLFRSIGKIVLNRIAVRTAVVAGYVDAEEALGEWEISNVGYGNTDVGASVLESWHLSTVVVDGVRDHYRPDGTSPVAHLLNLAAGTAHSRDYGFHGEADYWRFSPASYAATNTDVAMITAAAEKIHRWFDRLQLAVSASDPVVGRGR